MILQVAILNSWVSWSFFVIPECILDGLICSPVLTLQFSFASFQRFFKHVRIYFLVANLCTPPCSVRSTIASVLNTLQLSAYFSDVGKSFIVLYALFNPFVSCLLWSVFACPANGKRLVKWMHFWQHLTYIKCDHSSLEIDSQLVLCLFECFRYYAAKAVFSCFNMESNHWKEFKRVVQHIGTHCS